MTTKKVINKPKHSLVCQRCTHSWHYGGKNPFFTLCPRCRTTVRTRKNKALRPVQVGSPVQTSTEQITPIGDGEMQQ
ncbi:MAG: hypothetical protein WA364_00205 [Candidatus Nitrosopolaris sp.]